MRLGLCKYCLALAFWRRENEKEKRERLKVLRCVAKRREKTLIMASRTVQSWKNKRNAVSKTKGKERTAFDVWDGELRFLQTIVNTEIRTAIGIRQRRSAQNTKPLWRQKIQWCGFFSFFSFKSLASGFPKDIGIKPTNKPTTDGSIDFDTKSNVYQQAFSKACRQKWLKKTYMYMCIHIACRFDIERDWRANGCYGSVLPWRRHVLCKPFEVAASSKTRFF